MSSNSSSVVGRYMFSFDESTEGSLQFMQNVYRHIKDTTNSSTFHYRAYIDLHREVGLQTLMNDWFFEKPKYYEVYFRKKFRMDKSMFLSTVGNLEANFSYFQQGYDARNRKSFTAIKRCTLAIRLLATGNAPAEFDKYLCMSARTPHENLDYICDVVINLYDREFLCRPTQHDIACIFEIHEARHHIPGILGSIDCTHVEWKNCPRSLRGQYTRRHHGVPTIMLKVIASPEL